MPIRSGLMSGALSAVTTTASVTDSSSIAKFIVRDSPRPTSMLWCVWGRKPLMLAVIVYGPPTRTFRML